MLRLGNRELVREVNQEITRYAQELEPTITFDEATNIIVALLKMVGHFKAPRPEKELEPLAMRVAENAALMQRFRVAISGAHAACRQQGATQSSLLEPRNKGCKPPARSR
jgi:hypothetical protein